MSRSKMKSSLNLTEAAQSVGVSRATLGRHLKKGRFSIFTDKQNRKRVNISELIRCYGELVKNPDESEVSEPQEISDHSRCDELIGTLKNQIASLVDDKKTLQQQIEFLQGMIGTKLIEDKSSKPNSQKKGGKKKGKKKGKK